MWKPFPKQQVSPKRKSKICDGFPQQKHDRRHGQICDDLLRARAAGQRAGGVRAQAWRIGQRHLHPHRAAPPIRGKMDMNRN